MRPGLRGSTSAAANIDRSDFWKFGLVFGLVFFAGLPLIVLPRLQVIR